MAFTKIVYVSKISNISIIFQINSWTAWSHDIDDRAEVRIHDQNAQKETDEGGLTERENKRPKGHIAHTKNNFNQ